MRVRWLVPSVDVGGLAGGELALRKRVDVLVMLPAAARQLEPRHRHRLSTVVDDLDVLAGRTASALHAQMCRPMPAGRSC